MAISTKYRSDAVEIMDDFAMEGPELREALEKIAQINQILGGNKLTLDGVQRLLTKIPKNGIVTIVDFGCGNGDMLRSIADYYSEQDYMFNLIGIDANAYTIKVAEQLSTNYDISYRCEDLFKTSFSGLHYDIGLCTLTLHHFSDDEIITLLEAFYKNANYGLVINDLHRSSTAYHLFTMICKVFSLNKMSREDGLTSILRGFKKEELVAFSKKMKFKKYEINWKWAYRYQWIIEKI